MNTRVCVCVPGARIYVCSRVHICVFTCTHVCVPIRHTVVFQENTCLLSDEHVRVCLLRVHFFVCVFSAHIVCSRVHTCAFQLDTCLCSRRTHVCYQMNACVCVSAPRAHVCVFICTHMCVPHVHICVFMCPHMFVPIGHVFVFQVNTCLFSD